MDPRLWKQRCCFKLTVAPGLLQERCPFVQLSPSLYVMLKLETAKIATHCHYPCQHYIALLSRRLRRRSSTLNVHFLAWQAGNRTNLAAASRAALSTGLQLAIRHLGIRQEVSACRFGLLAQRNRDCHAVLHGSYTASATRPTTTVGMVTAPTVPLLTLCLVSATDRISSGISCASIAIQLLLPLFNSF